MTDDTYPDDLPSLLPWLPAVRHCRAVARQSTGYAVITLRIVINEMGVPCPGLWMLPTLDKLVPRATADQALAEIVRALTSE